MISPFYTFFITVDIVVVSTSSLLAHHHTNIHSHSATVSFHFRWLKKGYTVDDIMDNDDDNNNDIEYVSISLRAHTVRVNIRTNSNKYRDETEAIAATQ